MQLQGKTAVVTGGAVRLGRAMALTLAEAGMRIGLHYFHSEREAGTALEEIRAAGGEAVGIHADLRRPAAAAAAIVDEARAEFGTIDILVNNAAIFEAGTLAEVTADQWDRHVQINLAAPLFLCRAFAAQLQSGQRGHIVNIADWRGTRPDPGHLVYTLTKSGLIALTGNLALQLAPDVQVNAIAPGAVLPPHGEDDEYLRRLAERLPLRRSGRPRDVTDALLYLLRSDFVTGEVLDVAGGEQLRSGPPPHAP